MNRIAIDRHLTYVETPLALGPRQRLLLAIAFSLLLHLALMLGLRPVPHPAGAPRVGGAIQARIQKPAPAGVEQSGPAVDTEPALPAPPKDAATPAPPRAVQERLRPTKPQASPPPAPIDRPAPAAESSPILPQLDIPLLEDPTYYPGKLLDVHPAALQQIKPVFPETATVSGTVTLVLLIDESGMVRDLAVVDAQPEGYFEQSALDAFRNARFSPGQKDGRVVKSRIMIRVAYEIGAP